MHNVKYDYSSCHIDVPDLIANDIINWGRENVTDEEIYVTHKDPTYGREDHIHITILYGIHCETSVEVRKILENSGPIKVKMGKVDIFTDPYKFDVVMINVKSDELMKLNEQIKRSVTYSNRHSLYSPHATISYVKKGKGWRHKGVSVWEGKEFTCNLAVFSSKNGVKESITL